MSKLVKCPTCKSLVHKTANFCPRCGRPSGKSIKNHGFGCGCLVAILAIVVVIALLMALPGGPPGQAPVPFKPAEETLARPVPSELKSREACSILSDLFVDNPPKEEIRRLLDPILSTYNTPTTEDDRLRAGSVLIGFRKMNGVREIDFLAYMSRNATPGSGLSFPEAAALYMTAYEIDHPTPSRKRD